MVNKPKNIGTSDTLSLMGTNNHEVKSLAHRLWAKSEPVASGCIVFTGYKDKLGYGYIGRGRRGEGNVRAHRASWEVTYGPIPEGMFVCHRCDNPSCIRPEHLFLGTSAENVRDMLDKGRGARGAMLPHTKLTPAQVQDIREKYKSGVLQRELASEYGVSQGHISGLVNNRKKARTW